MPERAEQTSVRFSFPFWLSGLSGEQPAGEYRVAHVWEAVEGLTRTGYRNAVSNLDRTERRHHENQRGNPLPWCDYSNSCNLRIRMKCPVDDTELAMTERQGIEIDYCPKCRGVWLDRGELDKIIERSADSDEARPSAPSYPSAEPRYRDDRDHRSHRPRKTKSLLGEIFDF